jgi:predicted nucleotide-binding protein (sugar kinase/HSP70/actin superfamily)
MEKKGRIGIPRALMFYRYFPFWQTFFEGLGWEVVVSQGVGKKGKIVYFEDSCLPMKLLVTHAVSLAGEVDYLFVPRLVSLHPKYILCPKFRGAPDILRLAIEKKVSILDETIDLRTGRNSYRKAFLKIGGILGASTKGIHTAFLKAEQSYSVFQKEWVSRLNRLPTRDFFKAEVSTPMLPKTPSPDASSLRVAFIGHPYNLYDTDINKDIPGLAKQLGMEIVPSDFLSEKVTEQEISYLSKEIYWSSGREIVGSLFHFLSGGVDGVVFITSFKCGIDALLQEFVKRMLRIRKGFSVPFLVLSFDEHTGREGLTTRLEAFKDVIDERKRQAPNNNHPIPNPFQ